MTDEFDAEMIRLARRITDKALSDDTPLQEALDAFKVLTAYHGLRLKHRGAGEDDGENASGFGDFSRKIEESQDGAVAEVRSRPRRSDA